MKEYNKLNETAYALMGLDISVCADALFQVNGILLADTIGEALLVVTTSRNTSTELRRWVI